jgi:diguanylate cyclase (GGDEF)-like protein
MLQTVMIVDDSLPLHALVKAQLVSEQLKFHSVHDGASAVALAADLLPDLILLDIDMPDMDGFEACRRIKADPATASIPLMFLSAESLPAEKHRALSLGAFDYIQKPFKPDQLRERVRCSLRAVPVSKEKKLVDPLTGLWNKAYFEVQLREQYVLAQLASEPISCIVTAIDQIGAINANRGTTIANQVVRKVANVLSSNSGMFATTCCLPNHRFATLLRRSDRFDASRHAEKLRAQLKQKLNVDSSGQMDVTCSFGVCDSSIANAMQLFDRAVQVLNRASDRGGDCTSVARVAGQANGGKVSQRRNDLPNN